jgi:serine/threonine protein phosphatase PrpC
MTDVCSGGLAVSRTVGDVQLTEAAVPTPEVFTVPLHFDTNKNKDKKITYRFVIASDGLWDVFQTDEVGQVVAQEYIDKDYNAHSASHGIGHHNHKHAPCIIRRRNPKQAAKELLDSCIKRGGYQDDVTILVVDVSLAPSSASSTETEAKAEESATAAVAEQSTSK